MKLNLIKSAVFESDIAKRHNKRIVETVINKLGKRAAYRIFETYESNPKDYSKWLDVIVGYAKDEGVKLNNKSNFFDVAFAVLENDPANIDHNLQEAIANKLWIDYKASKQQSKIDRLHKVAREEEQLSYAIKRMKKKNSFEDEQFLSGAGMEEEQESDWDTDEYGDDYDDREYDEYGDPRIDREYDEYGDPRIDRKYDEYGDEEEEYESDWDIDQEQEDYDDDEQYSEQDTEDYDDGDEYDTDEDIPFTDDEQEDYQINKRGREMSKSRDLEDFDPSEKESYDRDESTSRRGKEMSKSRDLEDFDPSERQHRTHKVKIRREENEEQIKFPKNKLVHYKKDGNNYCVAIEDGPGDTIGLMINNRIKLVPIKDIEAIKAEENEETFGNSRSSNKVSLLHDVLTGEKSREHLTKLQKQIEDEGANVFTAHHTKSPRNPHPSGSFAHKSWQKGYDSAAKETWGPKPVKIDIKKPKAKPKKK